MLRTHLTDQYDGVGSHHRPDLLPQHEELRHWRESLRIVCVDDLQGLRTFGWRAISERRLTTSAQHIWALSGRSKDNAPQCHRTLTACRARMYSRGARCLSRGTQPAKEEARVLSEKIHSTTGNEQRRNRCCSPPAGTTHRGCASSRTPSRAASGGRHRQQQQRQLMELAARGLPQAPRCPGARREEAPAHQQRPPWCWKWRTGGRSS